MKRWLALMLLLCALPVSALEVAGVNVADKVKVGASELVLNGAGIRTRAIFKVYVGALYLTEKKAAAADALAQKGAKRVALTLLRDLSAQQLNEAFETGIQANSSAAEIEAYVATGEPMDKAGAYAIQGLASRFVTRIEGSYSMPLA